VQTVRASGRNQANLVGSNHTTAARTDNTSGRCAAI
jgi:hypothetical protein